VTAVSAAIGQLEADGHFGPFAVVLDQDFFLAVQTPDPPSLVLPQDRIIPFLGGGSLLRSSTLRKKSGVVVALGGTPVELVIAKDMSLQFLQVTEEPRFLFRVREKIALRIKEAKAIVTLVPRGPHVWSVSPRSGPVAGSTAANPVQVTIRGINFNGATAVQFGRTAVAPGSLNVSQDGLSIIVALPAHRPGTVHVKVTTRVNDTTAVSEESAADEFTYVGKEEEEQTSEPTATK